MDRTRTRGSLSAHAQYSTSHFPKTCANRITEYTGPTDVSDFVLGKRETTIDVSDPTFWKRKKKGEIIFHPYYHESLERTVSGSSSLTETSVPDACTGPNIKAVYNQSGSYFCQAYRVYVGVPTNVILITGAEQTALRKEVWTECMANRQSGSTNYVESLAELDKSFAMLRSPLINVHEFVKQFRRTGKRKHGFEKVPAGGYSLIQFLSSEWLRFRYGIKPLVSDVRAAMKALKKDFNSVKPQMITARGSGSAVRSSVSSGTFDDYPWRITYQNARAHQCKLKAMHIDTYKPDIFDDLGLTFRNTVGLFWELTRYSFVVDWFANVGSLIYANIPRVSLTPHGGVIVEENIWSSYYYPTSSSNTAPASWTVSGSMSDSYLMVDHTKVRTLGSGGDIGLVINSDFRLDNYTRATDAVTLVIQALNSIHF